MNPDYPRKQKYNLNFEKHEIKYSSTRGVSLQANLRTLSQEVLCKILSFRTRGINYFCSSCATSVKAERADLWKRLLLLL